MRPNRAVPLLLSLLLPPSAVFAHCDGLDGPVVKAARKALDSGELATVLVWVPKSSEAELKAAFGETLSVRKKGPEAKALADRYFFETLVRLHRQGEGAPFMGLKPAGRDLGPAIPAADKALETGDVGPLVALLTQEVEKGARERFSQAAAKSRYKKDDVEAGREYVRAYVEFIHYAERVHQAGISTGHAHEEHED